MLSDLRPKEAKAQVHLMRSFENDMTNSNVPDPYYGGLDGFQEVFNILQVATEGLLERIIDENKLKTNSQP